MMSSVAESLHDVATDTESLAAGSSGVDVLEQLRQPSSALNTDWMSHQWASVE